MAHCIIGGTFTYVHAGHLRLLAECRKFGRITIGLTSDSYVRRHKIYPSFSYSKRLAGLRSALRKNSLAARTAILEIENEGDVATALSDANAIIVSEETLAAAERINRMRKKNGLPSLKIISVPLAYGEDLKKISCMDIYNGKTDLKGKRKTPILFQAGTENPTKLLGAKRALVRVFGKKIKLLGHREYSKVRAHPFDSETFDGAKNRAHAAWKRANGKCDYSLGIESGLFSLYPGLHIDITVCCAYDGKEETYGTGMGFVISEEIVRMIKRNKSDLGKVMAEIAGIGDIGRKHGAIGHFSARVLHRSEQIEQATACAFVPRICRARVEKKNQTAKPTGE